MSSKRTYLIIFAALSFQSNAFASESNFFKMAALNARDLEHLTAGPIRAEKEMALATSLQEAGLPFAALKCLERILNTGENNSQYTRAVSALSTMGATPDLELLASQLLMKVYDKDPNAISALNYINKQSASYMVANRLFKLGKTSEAARLAETVSVKHPFYAKAQYLLALNDLSLKSAKDNTSAASSAIKHFEAVANTISSKATESDSFNLRNLALLGEARLYYEQAYALPEGNPERKALASKALDFYKQVPRFSNAWSHALFEMGWAYTLLDDYGDALGEMRSLQHPYFANAYYPEAEILSSIVYWYNCQWDRANQSLKLWNTKYEPLAKGLKEAVNARGEIPKLVAEDLKNNPQNRIFAQLLEALQNEKNTLSTNEYLKASPLPKELSAYYEHAQKDLKNAQSAWSKQRLGEMLADLDALKTRSSIISLETKTAEAKWLDQGREIAGIKRGRLARPFVPIDRDQFWWVTNSESWRDELGYYRLSVKSECYQ